MNTKLLLKVLGAVSLVTFLFPWHALFFDISGGYHIDYRITYFNYGILLAVFTFLNFLLILLNNNWAKYTSILSLGMMLLYFFKLAPVTYGGADIISISLYAFVYFFIMAFIAGHYFNFNSSKSRLIALGFTLVLFVFFKGNGSHENPSWLNNSGDNKAKDCNIQGFFSWSDTNKEFKVNVIGDYWQGIFVDNATGNVLSNSSGKVKGDKLYDDYETVVIGEMYSDCNLYMQTAWGLLP